MPMPEIVIQGGIQRAWDLLKTHPREFVAWEMRNFSLEKQEGYIELIKESNPVIHYEKPDERPRLPSFAISLIGESESPQGQYLGDEGLDYRDVPFPSPALLDNPVPVEDFFGLVYGDEDKEVPITVGGENTDQEDMNHFEERKNLHIQRRFGQESAGSYEQMGVVQRLWHKDGQRLHLRSVGDDIRMGITVTTSNYEKTWVFYRLLKTVLRGFRGWFNTNGIQNMIISGNDLQSAEELLPTTSGSGAFRRQLVLSFYHEDYTVEIASLLKGWILEVGMATEKSDGTLDFLPIYKTNSKSLDGKDIE